MTDLQSEAIPVSQDWRRMGLTRDGQRLLVDVMSVGQQRFLDLLLGGWLTAQVFFWVWWLDSSHVVSVAGFLFNTALICWFTLLPGYYFFFLRRMKRSNPSVAIPDGWRVAMVVTKAPSEPFEIVKQTLVAMLEQDYPHDTWLADEDPSRETFVWCRENGIRVSTRKGISAYHQKSWPRRTRCKEGNLAYFYDMFGYDSYDFVAQLDADHRPAQGYLKAMLRPFIDPGIGYVSAPSICDTNAEVSWAARARLHAESTLHGSLQAGYNDGWAPLCIGSHYAVRTAALREIGGLGPELAEDHSTTLMMNSCGWWGVHAFDAEAHGDGPLTFGDCMTQEFQWSRSLVVVLLSMFPSHAGRLPMRLRLQFLFSELWYPLFAIAMAAGYAAPLFALITRTPLVDVSYTQFLLHSVPVTASVVLIVLWVRMKGWTRPRGSKAISWESAIFQLTRWPWILAGCLAAVFGALTRRQFEFRVTPKQQTRDRNVPFRLLAPYFAIASASFLTALLITDATSAAGYYYFALLNGFVYFVVLVTVVLVEARQTTHD